MSYKEAARPIVQQLEEDYKPSEILQIVEAMEEIARDLLPENWEAGIGDRNGETYTKRFYKPSEDLEIEVYFDEQGDDQHKIVLYKVRRDAHGDAEGSTHKGNWYASTEEEAERKAVEKMEEINEGELNV